MFNFKQVKTALRREWEHEKETARLLVFGGYRRDLPVDPERLEEERSDDDDDLPGSGLLVPA